MGHARHRRIEILRAAAHRGADRVGHARIRRRQVGLDLGRAASKRPGTCSPTARSCSDEVDAIRAQVKAWIADKSIDVVISTGGTGFTGRDVTPEAVEPLFEKKMDGFATLFLIVSHAKIGTSAIQTRATAGVANATYVFCLPGSPGACKDAWDEILVHQLDYRYRPCNFVEILPRLDEHLRRPKAQGATA